MIFPSEQPGPSQSAAGVRSRAQAWAPPGSPQLIPPAQRVWRRELIRQGQVLVAPGEQLEAERVVAEGTQAPAVLVVSLGWARAVVAPGEQVRVGQVVARRQRLLGRAEQVRAPVAGIVLDLLDGALLLMPKATPVRLLAQLPGAVVTVREGWGVEIEGVFGFLRGIEGTGEDLFGRLGQDIGVFAEPVTHEMMRAAMQQGLRAVVAASIPEPAPLALPCLLTEGWGSRPMAPPIAEALRAHLGAPAAIQFRPDGSCILGFAMESGEASAPAAPLFGQGSWVRLPGGQVGRFLSSTERLTWFPSGVAAPAAEVDLGDSTISTPRDHLEWVA